jgi:hypothetical protein
VGLFGLTIRATLDAFILAFVTSCAVAAATSIVRLVRRLNKTDHRVQEIAHRQRHILRWVRRSSNQQNIPFPVDDDPDYDMYDDEGEQ